jgi:hydrogenase maturation protein HypF
MADVLRYRVRIHGVVQGVGFRPFVFRLALRHGLTGLIANDPSGIILEVQGESGSLAAFQSDLRNNPPPASAIDGITVEELVPIPEPGFQIVGSRDDAEAVAFISPDLATCENCLRELFDPSDRRFRYPFLNCTQCGPRFTIVRRLPYDRPNTTIARFTMCPRCWEEYLDPSHRRFHAQPNACPICGPRIWLVPSSAADSALSSPNDVGSWFQGETALCRAISLLEAGRVLAVKGIGGFHLACDATDDQAVERLRRCKEREGKPFALMAASLEMIRRYVEVHPEDERLLTSPRRPVVLLGRRSTLEGAPPLSQRVAPGNASLGFMLPYSPLHHLLIRDRPLVMTSGNRRNEPIVRENDEALRRLSPLVDALVLHDRPIEVACDDSVVRTFLGHEYLVRRSRGYAPMPLPWPSSRGPRVLAVGGELKATFCLTVPPQAYLSQHIGDMENLETEASFDLAVSHFLKLYGPRLDRIACDLHPDYLSTRWAERYASALGCPLIRVQHHHAHAAALLAEHDRIEAGPVLGMIFDGTGYGPDGAIWGGEVLQAQAHAYRRLAHLKYVAMPGGNAAIQRPYRMALAHLRAAGLSWEGDLPCVAACAQSERRVLERIIDREIQSPRTSSMGRFFDGCAALIGVRQVVDYESQAAIELESLVDEIFGEQGGFDQYGLPHPRDGFVIVDETEPWVFDPGPLWRALVDGRRRGLSASVLAAWVHSSVSELIIELAKRLRNATGLSVVALSGGVFQNLRLLGMAHSGLKAQGFEVLIHRRVPTNDGGLALGQAAVAWAMSQQAPRRTTPTDHGPRRTCEPADSRVATSSGPDESL